MYKISHEFSFELSYNESLIKFIGKLIFENKDLNSDGSLHTEKDMENFGIVLNRSIALPEYWTLEMLTKTLYDNIKPIFPNLSSISLTIEQAQYRVAEYHGETESFVDIDSIVELPVVG